MRGLVARGRSGNGNYENMTPIHYRGFWDRPLSFVVEHRDKQLLFWRDFDEAVDEYEDAYRVFVLPDISAQDLAAPASWENLPERAVALLGIVPVKDVKFDATYRKEIDANVIDALLKLLDKNCSDTS